MNYFMFNNVIPTIMVNIPITPYILMDSFNINTLAKMTNICVIPVTIGKI